MLLHRTLLAGASFVAALPIFALSCSSDDDTGHTSPPVETGTLDANPGAGGGAGSGGSPGVEAGSPSVDGSAGGDALVADAPLVPLEGGDASVTLVPNGTVSDPGGGALYLTASGEALAVTGYDFPPATADEVFMVDGWIFHIEHEIINVDHVQLWESPDTVPADQSKHGAQVAHLDGPWAIDLHMGGPLTGEGGDPEKAQPFAAIVKKDDGSAFDTALRYAFGFDTVAASASASARNVNLDTATLSEYAYMVAHQYSVLYVGTASRPDNDACATAGGTGYDFSKIPKTLRFRMGFSTPTSYVNCQNGSQFPGIGGVNGEDYQRGIQFSASKSTVAQVTVHADHPFWESFAEESALRFDPIAAQYVGVTDPVATMEDMQGVDFSAFTDNAKKVLPLRTCVSADLYTPPYPAGEQLHFDPLAVPVNKNGNPATSLRDYYDYMRYTQSTQGHLNSQGLCFVSRNYPSPAGGS